MKAAAHQTDSRDRDRHLYDAAALLACIEDPFSERQTFAGPDRRRLLRLAAALPESHPAWRRLGDARGHAQDALRILLADP